MASFSWDVYCIGEIASILVLTHNYVLELFLDCSVAQSK